MHDVQFTPPWKEKQLQHQFKDIYNITVSFTSNWMSTGKQCLSPAERGGGKPEGWEIQRQNSEMKVRDTPEQKSISL